ncbi:hypothetical protein DPEC_G00308460 [Dallia pectoralis]|uniref:Uncharacterized protein n=1 Tax=Dallia pectoralis TaxID=75939 RepID=A0ACC2FEY4_DALPE|nr:hypothetical protein DPEC_G00308460 [Dallia pectoralis]
MKYGVVVITAGFAGLLSFGFLVLAIVSDYWYIVDLSRTNLPDWEELNSFSGLWRIREGKNATSWPISSFVDTSNSTEIDKQLMNLHKVIVTVLPLSLLLVVLGGIFGLVSSLSRNPSLLVGTATYFLFCSHLTLSGVSVYVSYCQLAREKTDPEILADVLMSYGWSLGSACLSYGLEVAAGLLLMLAARIAYLTGRRDDGVAIAMTARGRKTGFSVAKHCGCPKEKARRQRPLVQIPQRVAIPKDNELLRRRQQPAQGQPLGKEPLLPPPDVRDYKPLQPAQNGSTRGPYCHHPMGEDNESLSRGQTTCPHPEAKRSLLQFTTKREIRLSCHPSPPTPLFLLF